MKFRAIDWKFLANAAIAIVGLIVGIAVPFLTWKVDLQAKSISVRILASTSLQPIQSAIDDLRISIGDTPVNGAFITTLTLSNSGAKPIPAGDFESPVELMAGSGIEIVRVQVADRLPANLPAIFKPQGPILNLQPLLLNPGDTLKMVVITSGGKPTWTASGRIAGVSSIQVEEVTRQPMPMFKKIVALLSFPLSTLLYVYYTTMLTKRAKRSFSAPWTLATMAVCILLSSTYIKPLLAELGLPMDTSMGLLAPAVVLIVAIAAVRILLRNRNEGVLSSPSAPVRKVNVRKDASPVSKQIRRSDADEQNNRA